MESYCLGGQALNPQDAAPGEERGRGRLQRCHLFILLVLLLTMAMLQTDQPHRKGTRADLQKEAITELHDVGLVDGRHFSPVIEEGVAEGILRHAPRALLRDDLQALDHSRHYLVLQPTVLSLCVLSAAAMLFDQHDSFTGHALPCNVEALWSRHVAMNCHRPEQCAFVTGQLFSISS